MDKIAIIGLGLIGGSIGMALKQANPQGLQVIGYDSEPDAGRKAVKRGAVDKAPWRLIEVIEGAGMVIIATPVLSIRESMENIAEMLSPGCVVTDTGSTKEAILGWAEEFFPKEVSFVGGHPMAGKEASGIDNADPKLFQGARYVIIPGKGADENAVKAVLDVVALLGARPYFMHAQEHDSYVAAVSHLPILLSAALVSATTKSPAWRDMSRLAATGFRDVSRLAGGDPVMSLDICLTNREGILYWLGEAIKELAAYREMVEASVQQEGAERLGESLSKAWEARETWLTRYESKLDDDDRQSATAIPSASSTMSDLFFGTQLKERYQKILARQDSPSKERRPRPKQQP
ncbi:MAG: prephenate dehydrogenase/arogenate dehydrogenase family protein [Dehalococcoidia bacterium]|nr:prephenate dehydrogenase/arogenate dehydrogenase family protein [Dehalococcoidia bacterium]